jgi:hypothetical protein
MESILGEDHHETIACRAYRQLTLIVLGTDVDINTALFIDSIDALATILGQEHDLVRSLRYAEENALSRD